MNAYTQVVFDDWVYGTASVYTAAALNEFLSRCNSMTVHAIVDQATASATLTVTKETASDERGFATASTFFSAQALTAGATNSFVASAGNIAAEYARLNVTLGGPSPMAKVKLIVTLRTELG